LDLASLRILEEALVDFEGSVLAVSHDRFFLDRICDQIVAFEDEGIFITPGNFSYYLENKQAREEETRRLFATIAPSGSVKSQTGVKAAVSVRKRSFKEQRELAGIESAIQSAETRVEQLEAELNDPNFYPTRAAEAPKLVRELAEAKTEVSRLYSRWHELEQLPPP
jgi:ATP-binding cassette subfamily F protein uup